MHEIIKESSSSLILPWPPSVNTLWRHCGNKVLLSKKYRDYKNTIAKYSLFWKRKPIEGRISIDIKAYPPDKRKRDIDNILKSCVDCLMHANIFLDDSQIDKLSIQRMTTKKGGELQVFIEEIKESL